MVRKIITINEETCNGCGACAEACHEGAIAMVDGKAKLLRDDYCDGLGDCLPVCPVDAISFEEREAAAYDGTAVKARTAETDNLIQKPGRCENARDSEAGRVLGNWPVQIRLAPVKAPYFDGAKLLIAADCTAYAYGDFQKDFTAGRITLIGCPKLDMVDYAEKLTEIIRQNDVRSVTMVRMEVPCCGGIEHAVKQALQDSGKFIPWQVYTVSTEGRILP